VEERQQASSNQHEGVSAAQSTHLRKVNSNLLKAINMSIANLCTQHPAAAALNNVLTCYGNPGNRPCRPNISITAPSARSNQHGQAQLFIPCVLLQALLRDDGLADPRGVLLVENVAWVLVAPIRIISAGQHCETGKMQGILETMPGWCGLGDCCINTVIIPHGNTVIWEAWQGLVT